MNMSANLPNVNVVDLVFHEKDRTLSAATYGRSLWRTRIGWRAMFFMARTKAALNPFLTLQGCS